jgi:hypothetical protein
MKSIIHRVSLSFAGFNDDSLLLFGTKVHTQLFAMTIAYPAPPVGAMAMSATLGNFTNAKVAQAGGGKAATALKNTLREELLTMLRKLAYYVQMECNNDLNLLLDSGFDNVSTNRASTPLDKPSILRVTPGMEGQSLVTCTADSNARGHEVIVAEIDDSGAPGPFRPAVIRSSSRNIPIDGLMPGKLYAFQSRTLGGSTGFSNWSDVVVQRAA